MATPIYLAIDHVEVSGLMEWSMRIQQTLGGGSKATIRVQDRLNTWEPFPHMDVLAKVRTATKNAFRGEIVGMPVELPVGFPFRVWQFECSSYSWEWPQRLVGALDGVTWQDVDGLGDWVNIDPYAHSLATDKLTLQSLFDKYVRVDGAAFGTDTYVGEYLTDFGPIFWTYSNVQSALEEMAGHVANNLQFWDDADLEVHWVAIPAWQDLAQEAVAGGNGLAGGMPELPTSSALLPIATKGISGYEGHDGSWIGGRELKFNFDGASMAEQIYVRGGTGFVYNAPAVNPAGESVTIDPQGYGTSTSEILKLTFLATTKVWQKNANGLISSTFSTIGASGPFNVSFVRVPYNPANGKGGHFWKLLTGPKAGWLVDNDTNYFGYGEIRVDKQVVVTTPPSIGTGGSGWVNAVTQDPNKRQAYMEVPISTDRSIRDSIGGQALYRASQPTLRASIKVTGGTDPDGNVLGPDDWVVGMLVPIADPRLPTVLDGKYFVIQEVTIELMSGTDLREYTISFGDGPTSRYTWQVDKSGGADGTYPHPATEVVISTYDLSPGPNSTQVVFGQMTSKDGTPWHIGGKVVKWTLEAYNTLGALVPNAGKLVPLASATDSNGKARTVLTTGPADGLVYFVFAEIAVV